MEAITDITAIIDEADYKDPGRLGKFLQLYRFEKKGSCYKVRGTYKEVENLFIKLSSGRHHPSTATHGASCQQNEKASTHVRPVDVSSIVMAYMEQMCAKELKKIGGNTFIIVTQPDLRTVHNKPRSTVQVTFRPSHGSTDTVHADFVRQRFITFYQRTASDLQVTSVPVRPHDHKDLQQRFPQLLLEPSDNKNKVTVTGPFVHIAKLKEFLSQNTPSLSKSPMSKGSADTLSSKTPVPSPSHSKDPEDESCPICMEPILTTEKETLECKHSFCRNCLKKAFDYKPVCPTCGKLYGILKGTQPEGGKMDFTKSSSSLPGYEQYGTIIIQYNIPSGIQKLPTASRSC